MLRSFILGAQSLFNEYNVMPRQNRVTPFSEIVSTPARGTLMGNRGCLHNDRGEIRRQYQLKRWIICVLDFKNRHRPIMTPGHYTELFFLDEATALTAGHRPCAECQRERFNLFRTNFADTNSDLIGTTRPAAPVIDEVLHFERQSADGKKRTYKCALNDLPNGAFVTLDDNSEAYMVFEKNLLHWSPFGYQHLDIKRPPLSPVNVLTPPSIVRVLLAGYETAVHPSAFKMVTPQKLRDD